MSDFQMKTPVAFLIFNRPDTTAKVFAAIRQAKPPKLLVVADGPRPDRLDDVEKCKAARAIIEQVDWDCEVFQNYSDVNLGCKNRVSSGLDWVFNKVEEAIILEDDCLPHITFFRFCEELLSHYQNDSRIVSIVGCNFQFGQKYTEYTYYFSRLSLIWGWATWKRSWQYYDKNMSLWTEVRDANIFKHIFRNAQQTKYWTKVFQKTYDEQINSWGYRWILSCLLQNGLAITSSTNLVSNIGFDVNATHTTSELSPLSNIALEAINFPLLHPPYMIPNTEADDNTYKNYCQLSWLWRIKLFPKRIDRKMKLLLNY